MNSKFYSLILSTFLLFSQINFSNAQGPAWLWAQSVGNTINDKGYAITTDASGNSYITGSFQLQVDFDPSSTGFHPQNSNGDLDVFVCKFDNNGNYVWSKSFGGTNTDEGTFIATDNTGNVYVTGHFIGTVDFDQPNGKTLTSAGNYDVFIVKYDNLGNYQWARHMGGTTIDEPLTITVDGSGNIYTVGYFSTVSDYNPDTTVTNNLTSAGSQDIFVSKLNSSGNFVWAKNMGGSSGDRGHSIAVDQAGSVFTTGYFAMTADFDPDAVTNHDLVSNGSGDIFISKLDNAGNFVWANSIGKANSDRGNCIVLDAAGNIFTTGTFSGTVDFDPDITGVFNLTAGGANAVYLAKYTNAGLLVWAKAITNAGISSALGQSLAIDPANGNVYLSGSFTNSITFDPGGVNFPVISGGLDDVFIAMYDSSGNYSWAKGIGGTNADYCGSISLSGNGSLYISGAYYSPTIAFGATTITNTVSTGFAEVYIAKLEHFITGVDEHSFNNKINLYPNPASDKITVRLPEYDKNVDVTVSDLSGRIIYSATLNSVNKFEIKTENYSEGIYLLKINSEEFIATKKFVVAR